MEERKENRKEGRKEGRSEEGERKENLVEKEQE